MANASISQIKVGDITYDVCDAVARDALSKLTIWDSSVGIQSGDFTISTSTTAGELSRTNEYFKVTNDSNKVALMFLRLFHTVTLTSSTAWFEYGTYEHFSNDTQADSTFGRRFLQRDSSHINYTYFIRSQMIEWMGHTWAYWGGTAHMAQGVGTGTCRISINTPSIIGFDITSVDANVINPISGSTTIGKQVEITLH